MKKTQGSRFISGWLLAAGLALAAVTAAPARAQDMMQLAPIADHYTLGRFHYEAPRLDGWRQMANDKDSLTLVYAEQKTEDSIETRFGVTMEAHEIPEGTPIESAAALADLSRRQIAESRKSDLVALSTIEAVPSIDNLYTYRLLVHAPIKETPDAYEVYYVAMAPDKSQYVVIQCITKTQDYANELYFTQFYGSLASLKYGGGDAKAGSPAAAAPAPATKTEPAAKPAAAKDAAKPAAH